MPSATRARLARAGLTAALILVLVPMLAPTDLIASRGQLLQGLVGSYGHTHNWAVNPAMGQPTVMVGEEFPLTNDIITVSGGMMMDADTCQNQGCNFPNSQASNNVVKVSWSDGGAGGAFGFMNQMNQFTASNDVNQITHYRTSGNTGQVTISLTIDDVPEAVDPGTGQTIATANDPQTTGNKAITVWDVSRPTEGEKFKFGGNGSDFCDVTVAASTSVTWGITGITGSTVTYRNANPMQSGSIRYTNLPTSNGEFGAKTVTATKGARSRQRGVKIFFDKDAHNHGDAATDPAAAANWPNWYYYWSQTSASSGSHSYDAGLGAGATGQARFENGAWRAFVGPFAGTGPAGDSPFIWNAAEGIDLFAHICRHENQHVADLTADWGNANRVAADDADGDWLKDTLERGKTAGHAAGYDPAQRRTYADHFNYGAAAFTDVEDWALHRQPGWTNGDADDEDWSAGSKSKQWP